MRLYDIKEENFFKFNRPREKFEKGLQFRASYDRFLSLDTGTYYRAVHSYPRSEEVCFSRKVSEESGTLSLLEGVYSKKVELIQWFYDVLLLEVIKPKFGEGSTDRAVSYHSSQLRYEIPVKDRHYTNTVLKITQYSSRIDLYIEGIGNLSLVIDHLNSDYLHHLVSFCLCHLNRKGL